MEEPLSCLRRIDFDWIRQIDSVWEPHSAHIEGVHEAVLDALVDDVERMAVSRSDYSPLGQVVLGYPGAGKTHLLGVLLQLIKDKSYFVMVDMTDVSDFWSSVRLAYLDSLQRSTNGKLQYHRMLEQLLGRIKGVANPEKTRLGLARLEDDKRISGYINKILLGPLWERFPREIQKYRDLLTALFLLNSQRYEVSSIGYSWLQGIELEPESLKTFDFKQSGADAILVVEGLSWVMSLSRPTLLAFDQLDAIVAQHQALKAADSDTLPEQQASGKIIHQVAGGLMDVQGLTQRTLPLVCCLHRTWEILESHGVRSFSDRFRLPAHILTPLKSQLIGQKLVQQRVSTSLAGMALPDQDWPFEPGVFESMPRLMPRELLRLCDAARRRVITEESFSRLNPFAADVVSDADETRPNDEQLDTKPSPVQQRQSGSDVQTEVLTQDTEPAPDIDLELLERIDAAYEELQQEADVEALFAEHKEDSLVDEILQSACRCLVIEHPASNTYQIEVDEDFGNSRHAKVLHARLRLVDILGDESFSGDQENTEFSSTQEQHFAFRALLQSNPKTFVSRLTGAILAAGIDEQLSFRHLVVIRPNDVPRTRNCVALWKEFLRRGGVCIKPDEQLWRHMYALSELERAVPPGFDDWLRSRKPASGLSLFAESGVLPLIEKSLAGNQRGSLIAPSPREKYEVDQAPHQQAHEEAHQETTVDIEVSPAESSWDADPAEPVNAEPDKTLRDSQRSPAYQEDRQTASHEAEMSTPEADAFAEEAAAQSEQTSVQITSEGQPGGVTSEYNGYIGDTPVSLYGGLAPSETLIFGKRPDQSGSTDFVGFSFNNLLQHTAVVGAKGIGKTNLLMRMLEEASLAGLPAVVLEGSGAFAALGDPWVEQVDYAWPGDAERAQLCYQSLNASWWTPFNSDGRELPLASIADLLPLLPELAELVTQLVDDQTSERTEHSSLVGARNWPVVDSGRATVDLICLTSMGRYTSQPSGYEAHALTSESGGAKGGLQTERPAGVLLRILLSLMADLAAGIDEQSPEPPETVVALKALVFIDDALPFLMNQEGERVFQFVLAYAAQYGIGLVVSCDDPGLMSEERIPMFGNWVLGKGSSPEQIQAIQSLIREQGAIGHDVPWLQKGEFYCFSPGFKEATRTQIPAALSCADPGMTAEGFIHKAAAQAKTAHRKQISEDDNQTEMNRLDGSQVGATALGAAAGSALVNWELSDPEESDIIDIQW